MSRNFKNKYYLLRHGNSIANKENIIISNPVIGIKEYGLSKEGKNSVLKNCENIPKKNYLLYSSPFKRAKETAKITSNYLGLNSIAYEDDLRERGFGELDLQSSNNYKKVWACDSVDPKHIKWNVESVVSVYIRTSSVIKRIEKLYSEKDVMIVSHGDSLQILECWFKNMDPKLHRTLKPLEQGEFRFITMLKN